MKGFDKTDAKDISQLRQHCTTAVWRLYTSLKNYWRITCLVLNW